MAVTVTVLSPSSIPTGATAAGVFVPVQTPSATVPAVVGAVVRPPRVTCRLPTTIGSTTTAGSLPGEDGRLHTVIVHFPVQKHTPALRPSREDTDSHLRSRPYTYLPVH